MDWNKEQRERERLRVMYGQMSDGELLLLHATVGDLTDAAQAALLSEMKGRGLEEAVPAEEEDDAIADADSPEDEEEAGWRTLHVFQQTFEAQAAFRILEREGIEFAVEDRTLDENGEPIAGPAIQLALLVEALDWERCVGLLRRDAGLFPEPVVDPRGEAGGLEEEMVAVGEFEEAEDVEAAGRVLEEAGIGFRAVRHDGEDWERTSVEVRSEDQDRALGVLARLLEDDDARRL